MNFDAHQLQGLLYLGLGCASFFILLFTLRSLAGRSGETRQPETNSWPSLEPLWVVTTRAETSDIHWFQLQRQSGREIPLFKPGQFLTFQIGDDGKTQRSYSIMNSATNRRAVEVAVKKLHNGVGSGWFHELKAGDEVLATPPSGEFTDFALGPRVKRVFIAGGIGITPLLSMIHTNIETNSQSPMSLVYGARTEKDLAFLDRIMELGSRSPLFKYFPVISHDERYPGDRGFVNAQFLRSKNLIDGESHYFICGPTPMMENLVNQLLDAGVDETHIHLEAFASPLDLEKLNIPDREARITVDGRVLHYRGHQTLLAFLESQGIEIKSDCRAGTCGTCKCQPTGRVESLGNQGLTLTERRKGMALACVSFPLEDLTVKIAE